jgi:hypothetical protein
MAIKGDIYRRLYLNPPTEFVIAVGHRLQPRMDGEDKERETDILAVRQSNISFSLEGLIPEKFLMSLVSFYCLEI